MKKITKALILFCLAFAVNVQAQQIIFEDFENGDPFEAINIISGYDVTNNNTCENPSYRIGANLNSICNDFPDVPAINPGPGNCMTTNEAFNTDDSRLIYGQVGLNLNPGLHVVKFRTVHRYGTFVNYFETNTVVSAALFSSPTNIFLETVSLPVNNTTWIEQTLVLNPTTSTSNFILGVENQQLNGDFAIDDIVLCAPSIEMTTIYPNRWCMEEDINICGKVEGCGAIDHVELRIGRNNQVLFTLDVSVNQDGTFCYTSPNGEELFSLGLQAGRFYDVVPVLVLNDANQTTVTGDSHVDGVNNDFRVRGQTEASAIMNKEITDEVNDFNTFCEGDPIFFHGRAEQSDRFHVGVQRRLTGSPNAPWNWVGGKQENYDFDGAHYDLTNEFNFEVGYEYRVTFGIMDLSNCIGWTPVVKTFDVVNCCAIEPIAYSSFPLCTYEGHVFTMDVLFSETITEDDISLIYSTSPNFELLSTSVDISQPSGATTIRLTFESLGCSCDGDMLSFDIRLVGCEKNIWIMSENIPCCESECSEIDIEYLEVVGACEILNGAISYPFEGALDLVPGTEIISITPQTTNGLCPTRTIAFEYEVFNNTVIFSGTVQSLNPNCSWGDVELLIETDVTCCTFILPISYPPCKIGRCLENQPSLQSLCSSQLTIAVPSASGGATLTNNLTGQTTSHPIGTVQCVSHVSSNGTVVTYPCDGFIYNFNLNCAQLENPEDSNYDITITIGKCQYRFVGDFCKPFNCGVSEVTNGGSEDRGVDVEKRKVDGEISIHPSLINGSVDDLKVLVPQATSNTRLVIYDVQGRIIRQEELSGPSSEFSISNLGNGLYFAIIYENGQQIHQAKLVVTK